MLENKKITMSLIFMILTVIMLAIGFFTGSKYVTSNMQVLYISQAELLNIEKARIAKEPLTNKQLFFGKPEVAIKYVEQAQKEMSKNGSIILLADSKIYGSNVRSISKEIHNRITKRLAEEIK